MSYGPSATLLLGIVLATIVCPASGGERDQFFEAEDRQVKFKSTEDFFPVRFARPGSNVLVLEPANLPDDFAITYEWGGETYTVDEFNDRTNTNALLILKDGKIVTEIYRNGATPATRFISFSTGKSFTSTLVGIAYEDGLIDDLEDPLTKYLPSLTGSAYDGVTIRDALQMSSGVEWDEAAYDWADETAPLVRLWNGAMVDNRYRFVEGANTLQRQHEPGTHYNYNTLETCILGWLVETVTQQRMTEFMEERLWQAAGMEFDATWTLDGSEGIGREMAGGALNAALRDYGRYGLLMANGGKLDGKRIISEEWVKAATTPDREPVMFGNLYEEYELGYGYQWWVFPNGHYEAQGVYGQFIYVAPQNDVVIVKLSYWPEAWVDEMEYESYAFFEAAIEALR